MGRLKTSAEYFYEVEKIHDNFYTYPDRIYEGAKKKIKVCCPLHGNFTIEASSHKSGSGCYECGNKKSISKRKKWTVESYKEKISELHPDLDFTKTVYKNPKEKVTYRCTNHGEKSTYPYNLLRGHGCRNCSLQKPIISKEEWMKRFNKLGNDNIRYDKLPDKFLAEEKVTFTCKKHGDFEQRVLDHKNGKSCPQCYYNKLSKRMEENPIGWSYTNWKKAAEKSKNFESYKVYIIRCWNENEEFYKIGKTFTTIRERFKGKSDMPYDYEVVEIFEGLSEYMSKLEKRLQKKNKEHKYTPKLFFNGQSECYSKII